MSDLVPSQRWPSGLATLEAAVEDARSISVAVAFVTESGVAKLAEVLEPLGKIDLEVVARAGGATTPAALQALRDRLGAQVSIAIGQGSMRFHPKLWLIRTKSELRVLSGSGNLTSGGLEQNVEQFELTRMPLESEAAAEQEKRFLQLIADAYRLETVEGSVVWNLWLTTILKTRINRQQIQMQERKLDETPVKPKVPAYWLKPFGVTEPPSPMDNDWTSGVDLSHFEFRSGPATHTKPPQMGPHDRVLFHAVIHVRLFAEAEITGPPSWGKDPVWGLRWPWVYPCRVDTWVPLIEQGLHTTEAVPKKAMGRIQLGGDFAQLSKDEYESLLRQLQSLPTATARAGGLFRPGFEDG